MPKRKDDKRTMGEIEMNDMINKGKHRFLLKSFLEEYTQSMTELVSRKSGSVTESEWEALNAAIDAVKMEAEKINVLYISEEDE